ncbi:MAG: glycosyltransferase family 2 protein [Deltaproteobacteria bacterium]|nr:MAG: glycosyltransferase family 2 protein [Deltaproteobacteria bacterium]
MNPTEPAGCSLVIPVFNEEEILRDNTETLVHFMDTVDSPYEILIISNGSTDNTVVLGHELERSVPVVRFFQLGRKGVGRAFQMAIRSAAFPYLLCLDMDLSVELDFIPRALSLLGDYHVVIGSKKTGEQRRSWVRRAGSDTFLLCARWLLGLPYDDYSIGAKAYHRAVVENFVERINHGTSYVLEIIYLAQGQGYRIGSIPVQCEDLRGSRFNLVHEAVYRFYHLFRLWFTERQSGKQ